MCAHGLQRVSLVILASQNRGSFPTYPIIRLGPRNEIICTLPASWWQRPRIRIQNTRAIYIEVSAREVCSTSRNAGCEVKREETGGKRMRRFEDKTIEKMGCSRITVLITVTGACGGHIVQHVGMLQHHLQCRTLNSYQHIQGCQMALILIRIPTTSHQFFQMAFWMAQ